MKEDIKIVEEYLEKCEYKFNNGSEVFDTELYKPIENLLKGYKELKEENKFLKSEIQHKNDQMLIVDREVERRFIPISVIQNKLEKLKEKEQELSDDEGFWGSSELLYQINILEELLEES